MVFDRLELFPLIWSQKIKRLKKIGFDIDRIKHRHTNHLNRVAVKKMASD